MKRILIVRTSAIGDVVFASPLAAAVRRTHPDAFVAWLVEVDLPRTVLTEGLQTLLLTTDDGVEGQDQIQPGGQGGVRPGGCWHGGNGGKGCGHPGEGFSA